MFPPLTQMAKIAWIAFSGAVSTGGPQVNSGTTEVAVASSEEITAAEAVAHTTNSQVRGVGLMRASPSAHVC